MKVAVPRSQHSPTLGQLASSQTVCRLSASIDCFSLPVGRPAGRRDLQPRRLALAKRPALDPGRAARVGARAGDVDALGPARSDGGMRWLRRSCGSDASDPRSRPSARPARGRRPRPKPVGERGRERVEVLLGAELAGERGHPAGLDPAGHDPLERLQVVVDVDREAVGGDPAADVDADRADLARVARRAAARSPTQTPVRPSISRASTPQSPSAAIIARSIRRTKAWTSSGSRELAQARRSDRRRAGRGRGR